MEKPHIQKTPKSYAFLIKDGIPVQGTT
jgi:hypothetical protein